MFASKVIDYAEDPIFEIRTMNNEYTYTSIQYLGHQSATTTFFSAQIQVKLHDQPLLKKYSG